MIGLLLLDPLSLELVAVVLVGVALVKDEVALSELETNVKDVEGRMEDDVTGALVTATLEALELLTTAGAEVVAGAAVVVGAAVVAALVVVCTGGAVVVGAAVVVVFDASEDVPPKIAERGSTAACTLASKQKMATAK
jgi:hypothetical protein